MNLSFDKSVAIGYNSGSQKVRVMSENWVTKNLICPSCISKKLLPFPNNNPAADFYCSVCSEEFELKSKMGLFGKKIVDGAYSKMIERINAKQTPNFLLLSYSSSYLVNDLLLIPKHFFIPEIIEKRPPLNQTARRAGWVGCNILLHNLPQLGMIPIIKNTSPINKFSVNEKWKEAYRLINENGTSKGWLFEILSIVDSISKKYFSLDDIYGFEQRLSKKFPNNKNIKPKIRQQLQRLRDLGLIQFTGSGAYYIPSLIKP